MRWRSSSCAARSLSSVGLESSARSDVAKQRQDNAICHWPIAASQRVEPNIAFRASQKELVPEPPFPDRGRARLDSTPCSSSTV